MNHQSGSNADRPRQVSLPWYEKILVPSSKPSKPCLQCGRTMWLPKCKMSVVQRCSPKCVAAWRASQVEARRRICQTCGVSFVRKSRPIPPKFCSQACNTASRDALQTPESKRRALEAMGRKAFVSDLVGDDRRRAWSRAYRKANPDKVKEWSRRRVNARQGLPSGSIKEIGNAQKWKCAICRARLKLDYHADHITPVAKGGDHVRSNIQLLCPTCNLRKRAHDPIDYMRSLGRLL